jgi:hypothetical protein
MRCSRHAPSSFLLRKEAAREMKIQRLHPLLVTMPTGRPLACRIVTRFFDTALLREIGMQKAEKKVLC